VKGVQELLNKEADKTFSFSQPRNVTYKPMGDLFTLKDTRLISTNNSQI